MKLETDDLPKLEIGGYFVLWISSVTYSIYNVIVVSKEINYNTQDQLYIAKGWLTYYKDVFDDEWRLALKFLNILCPWVLLHLTVAEILRQLKCIQWIPVWYITISIIFCINIFGVPATLLILVQPSVSVLLILLHNRVIIWIVNLLFIVATNALRENEYLLHAYLRLDGDTYSILMITLSWITMKSISNCLDLYIINKSKESVILENSEIVKLYGYALYLPSLLYGPIELYSNFNKMYSLDSNKSEFLDRLKQFLCNIVRYSGWLVFTEFSLHFVYVTALQYNLRIVSKSFWATCGLGYCMGQFFHLKYVVLYGLSTSVMKFENISAPPIPKCIAHIHLYSYMWKYFDYGLYTFLIRYIYIPTGGNRSKKLISKMFSSFLCFTFVFIWHGMQLFIFLWSALNFLGVAIENLSAVLSKSKMFRNNIEYKMSKTNFRRFKAIVATPLMIASALSNFFFFGGMEVGLFFIETIIEAPLFINGILIFCIYTLCQVSSELLIREKRWKEKHDNGKL